MPSRHLWQADEYGTFERAVDVEEWIFDAFLNTRSPLYHIEHEHLREARVGVLWSNIPVSRRGTPIAGTASIPRPHSALSGYERQIQHWFMRRYFGIEPLNFLITLDAPYAARCVDVNFLALIKHELVHCAQAKDEEGELIYTKKDFKPIYVLGGHDVEEQISVVRDFGLVGRNVREFVEAANNPPRIAQAEIDWACGTCLKAAA
jgi:hypothetical protein